MRNFLLLTPIYACAAIGGPFEWFDYRSPRTVFFLSFGLIFLFFSFVVSVAQRNRTIRTSIFFTLSKNKRNLLFLLAFHILCTSAITPTEITPFNPPQLSKSDLEYLADTFLKRECGSDPKKLVWWNAGEPFPSLGIGHFIWHPEGTQKTYRETFPALIQFLTKNNVAIPVWLKNAPACPWKSKADLDADPRKQELMQLLQATAYLQAVFIVNSFWYELAAEHEHLPVGDAQKIAVLAASPKGLFALIDYAHFKGFGANKTEQYNGQGWGLFDVISHMKTVTLKDFQQSAQTLLQRRVQNAPIEKQEHEKRWLPGWINRINQYQK